MISRARPSDPEHIAISRSKGIHIDWKDGHRSDYSLDDLRKGCPCATCTSGPGPAGAKAEAANPLQLYKPALKIVDVEPVGSYAIRIRWNDGHNTGIYSFEHLRSLCPCERCRPLEAGAGSGAAGE